LGAGAAPALTAAGRTTIPQPPLGKLGRLPVAPAAARVDLAVPSFSNPTRITNPLFPISRLRSAILVGRAEGQRLRVETTLLPGTRTITWNGRRIRALESQFAAFLGGRIHEVAIDRYAQADDGAVWYLGEDVFNYERGVVADREGTWRAGRDGPAAMIMPARPTVGDVYRTENVPGLVFEEVTVRATGKRVRGPAGLVGGAILVRELHQDGKTEGKLFAPGYGEFFTGAGSEVEALALAVPTDARPGPPPRALGTLLAGAERVLAAARTGDWTAASGAVRRMAAGGTLRGAPPRLAAQLDEAMSALGRSVEAQRTPAASLAAIEVARAAQDLRLRHLPAIAIDRARFALWARQLLVDADAGDRAGVSGDIAALRWTADRIRRDRPVDRLLRELRVSARRGDLPAVAEVAERLSAE
jgi:hypothetical protein